MRYFYWAILALNFVILITNIVRGSSTWWVSLIGIVAISVALALHESTRRSKARARRSHGEFMQRMNSLRRGGF